MDSTLEAQVTFGLGIFSVAVLLPLLLIALYINQHANPPVPGPSFRDYLPGGIVYQLYADTRISSDVIYRLLEQYGKQFNIWFGPVRIIITAEHEDVAQILSTADVFTRTDVSQVIFGQLAPEGLFSSTGAPHGIVKRSMREQFNHSMLKSFQQKMNEAVQELCSTLTDAIGKGPVDISAYIAVTTFCVITNVAFSSGMTREKRLRFNLDVNIVVDEMMKELVGYPIRQKLTVFGIRDRYLKTIQKIQTECLTFIEQRLAESKSDKESRPLDMLDTIIGIADGNATKTASLTVEFALAGSHTTAQTVTWAIFHLCSNKRVRNKLESELDSLLSHKPISEPLTLDDVKNLKYANQVWKETLRRRSIGASIMRKVAKDVQLKGSGLRLPKGTVVSAFFGACQQDPQLWRNPQEFRPERWDDNANSEGNRLLPGSYLPFGAGAFSCAGRFLADYEGPLIIAELYRRFSFELDCKPEEVHARTYFVESAKYMHGKEEREVPIKISLRQC